MQKRLEWKWQELDESTRRVQVIGGWIVQTKIFEEGKKGVMISESSVFIPDTHHYWTILKPKADSVVEQSALANEFEAS